jgi:hypothetical protein
MRRSFEGRLSAVAALAALLFPSDAEAMLHRVGVGVQAGVSLFHKKAAFTVNLEAYTTWGKVTHQSPLGCGPGPQMAGLGPMVGVNVTRGGPRLIAGALGGTAIGDSSANVGGEVGAVWNAAGDRGLGLHLGGDVGLQVLAASIESESFREVTATGGLRFGPPYGANGRGCSGRPRRDGEGCRVTLGGQRGWAAEAQEEAESVLAFLDLATELMEHDAPPELIAAALDSAEDEVRHALLCAAEAHAMPRLDAWEPRATLRGNDGLERLAHESIHDGWINEGNAARAARAKRERATGTARRALAIIASDEARHAEVGARIATWALDRRPRVV